MLFIEAPGKVCLIIKNYTHMKFLATQVFVFAFALMAFGNAFAQKNMSKFNNPKVVKTQILQVSAEEAWKVVAQFDNLAELTPSFLHDVKIEGKIAEGCKRTCTSADKQSMYKEKITYFNEKEMYYRYAVMEGLPVKDMENSFRVIALGKDQSMVVWTSGYEFMENPNMTEQQFNGFIDAALGEMFTNMDKLTASR